MADAPSLDPEKRLPSGAWVVCVEVVRNERQGRTQLLVISLYAHVPYVGHGSNAATGKSRSGCLVYTACLCSINMPYMKPSCFESDR